MIGPNGAGKTTMLRTLIGELPPVEGQVQIGHNVRIGYYSQTHSGLTMERTILDEIRQVTTLSEEGARSFLGRFLFSGDDVFKADWSAQWWRAEPCRVGKVDAAGFKLYGVRRANKPSGSAIAPVS